MELFLPLGSEDRRALHHRTPGRRFLYVGASVFVASLVVMPTGLAQSIDAIEPIEGGTYTEVGGVSADGLVVVGHGSSSDTTTSEGWEAFIWTLATGTIGLGFLDETDDYPESTANAVSSDGTVEGSIVVGDSFIGNYPRGFRWTEDTGMLALVLPEGGTSSHANDISDDGTVIVGWSAGDATYGNESPVYWTDDGMDDGEVHFLDPDAMGRAYGVNSDGTYIVGQWVDYDYSPNSYVAFLWSEDGGFLSLGQLGGGASAARAVNGDGTVVVGNAAVDPGYDHAFRWTEGTGMEDLGVLDIEGHNASIAYALSDDGTVVVGTSWNDTYAAEENYAAFYWTTDDGMQSLADVLTEAGVDITDWELYEATGVSGDGTVIVGDGLDGEGRDVGYIARLVEGDDSGGGSGIITTDVLQRSALSMTALTESGNDYLDRLLQTNSGFAGNCTECVFGYGFGGTLRGDDPAGTLLVGGTRQLQSGVVIGGSLAALATETPLVYDGSIGTAGVAATLFAETTTEFGLTFTGAVSADLFSADITRGYLNGNTPTASYGDTAGRGIGASFTVAYDYPVADRFTLTPFASASATATQIDGWTETGGAFPVSFDAISDTLAVTRLGVTLATELEGDMQLWGSLAWAHRYNEATTDISGTLIGISDLTVAGALVAQDWLELSAGINMPVYDDATMLSASLTASLASDESFLQARTGLSHSF